MVRVAHVHHASGRSVYVSSWRQAAELARGDAVKGETEACKALRMAVRKLVDLEFEASAVFYKTGEHQKLSNDASTAVMDVVAVYGAHMGWGRPATLTTRDAQKDADPRVLAILTRLVGELEEIEFAQYPGGVRGARKDFIRGRVLVLHDRGEGANLKEVADVLKKSHAFFGEWDVSTRQRLEVLARRLEAAS
jgi:hypothetical protein